MKRICTLLTLTLLISCTQKIETNRNFENIISFEDPILARNFSTKAKVFVDYPKEQPFAVFAFTYGGGASCHNAATSIVPFFDPEVETVSYNAQLNRWTTSKPYYWPTPKWLSFYAASPIVENAGYNNVIDEYNFGYYGLNTNITLDTEAGHQVDFLVSELSYDKARNDGYVGTDAYGVELTFHHALSQMAFSARLAEELENPNDYVKILNLELHNVAYKGEFQQRAKVGSTRGTFTWSNQNLATYSNVVKDTDVELTTTANEANFHNMLIVPFTFGTGENKPYISVQYEACINGEVVTKTAKKYLENLEYTKDAISYNDNKLLDSYKYKINLIINPGREIYFYPEVNDWDEVQTDEIIDLREKLVQLADANCFMIPIKSLNRYEVPTERVNTFWNGDGANSANALTSGFNWYPEVLWQEGGDSEPDAQITFCDEEGNSKTTFTGNEPFYMKVYSSFGRNALVALKRADTNEILWSWHLWMTDYQPGNNPSATKGGQVHQYTGPAFEEGGAYYGKYIMDRNLGATITNYNGYEPIDCNENTSIVGLYYQFGRKDPFKTNEDLTFQNSSVTYSVATNNPTNFYSDSYGEWNSETIEDPWGQNITKSIYDPCPSGWRIPLNSYIDTKNPWRGFYYSSIYYPEKNNISKILNGTQYADGTTIAFYPDAKYRDFSTSQLSEENSGRYWSSRQKNLGTSETTGAFCMIQGKNIYSTGSCSGSGYLVRCIQE